MIRYEFWNEFSLGNDKKNLHLQGRTAWEWNLQKGQAVHSGWTGNYKGNHQQYLVEPYGSISGYAVFGNWHFMKPQSGKSGDMKFTG